MLWNEACSPCLSVMSDTTKFAAIEEKMKAGGVRRAAIDSFRKCYLQLLSGDSGMIAEEDITPAKGVHAMSDIPKKSSYDRDLLAQTVVIKLNGGLGTSMGLEKVKSLLEVKPGLNFLDIIAKQVLHLRESTGASVRCLLMNSFSTGDDTFEALAPYLDRLGSREELELLQNKAPKLDAETLQPVEFSENPELEWCPPGHGDLYSALLGSGQLDRLLEEGVKYAFVSNSDNLGAVLDPSLLSFFAESDAPFMMEVTRRTAADRKGGHLASRKADGALLLREVAQTDEADLEAFQDIDRHKYFNTNNIWVRLDVLKEQLEKEGGALNLPMIRNTKTVDPRDPETTKVFQLEVAMGAAIGSFEGAAAIEVPRSRFAPVKTTADLLSLRSDAYEITNDAQVMLAASRDGKPPVTKLSSDYKFVDSLKGLKVPSLIEADMLELLGPVEFEDDVVIRGFATFGSADGGVSHVKSGVYGS